MKRFLAGVLAFLAALFSVNAYAQVSGKVIRVWDGDTFDMVTDAGQRLRIRIAGIDAPEEDQPYGNDATRFASGLIESHQHRVTVTARESDDYGRIIGHVQTGNVDLGYALIRAGLAWHYRQYSARQPGNERVSYAGAERSARRENRGLWKQSRPEAPWTHRHELGRAW